MSPNEMRSGVATYGRPRQRRIVLEPKSTICVCGTDTELGPCPVNCPTRHKENR
jgi:hypothetical protein